NRLKQIWYEKNYPDAPWLTMEANILLNQLIKKNDIGLEFGSGRSTIWFAKRCKFIYSVESNSQWYDKISKEIKMFNNIEYHFGNVNLSFPEQSEYLAVLESLNNQTIDFIVNDGKIRGIVAIKSIDKLKPGGLMIVDNAERYLPNKLSLPESIRRDPVKISTEWHSFMNQTTSWRKIWTTNGVSSTLIIFKP